MNILALDIATKLGWAFGSVGSVPTSGSVRFNRYSESSRNAVFFNCDEWLSKEIFSIMRPDMLVIEAMLPPGAKFGYTNTETRDRLAGLHGVVRDVAYRHGIYDIHDHSVSDIRQHFIGDRKMKREPAKRRTLHICRALGWPVDDTDAADATALWSYACSLIDPQQALKLSPLFNKALRAEVA